MSNNLPNIIYAQVSPRSIGGTSMFESNEKVTPDNVESFYSETAVTNAAVEKLRQAGFTVLQVTDISINISGTPELYQNAFNIRLTTAEQPVMKQGEEDTATFIFAEGASQQGMIDMQGTTFEDVIEGIAIEEPRYPDSVSATPPNVGYYHLDVPDDVARILKASPAHRVGWTGKGIRVAMIDSGQEYHPFFSWHGYRVNPTFLSPGATDAHIDEAGHGTGESANIFAIAPDITLLPVKLAHTVPGVFTNSTAGFNTGVDLKPHIITCSWGNDVEESSLSPANQSLATAIADAVRKGIVVIFSAGNGGFGFPGQHPEVISVGGVYVAENGSMQASDYASGFVSPVYPGRVSPDVSGLVGMQPQAAYIQLPVPGGSSIDQWLFNNGSPFPDGDETSPSDGWATFSGTSAAAPQIAGAAAVLLGIDSRLTPQEVKNHFKQTATDVIQGNSHRNTPGVAGPGPDTATGHGLVDVMKAARRVWVNTILPSVPVIPPAPPVITPTPNVNLDELEAVGSNGNGISRSPNEAGSQLTESEFIEFVDTYHRVMGS